MLSFVVIRAGRMLPLYAEKRVDVELAFQGHPIVSYDEATHGGVSVVDFAAASYYVQGSDPPEFLPRHVLTASFEGKLVPGGEPLPILLENGVPDVPFMIRTSIPLVIKGDNTFRRNGTAVFTVQLLSGAGQGQVKVIVGSDSDYFYMFPILLQVGGQ